MVNYFTTSKFIVANIRENCISREKVKYFKIKKISDPNKEPFAGCIKS